MEADQADGALHPGDYCHHGSNALPLYRVIFIDDGKAWLRDVNTGADSVMPLIKCRACTPEALEAGCEPPAMPQGLTWPDGTLRP